MNSLADRFAARQVPCITLPLMGRVLRLVLLSALPVLVSAQSLGSPAAPTYYTDDPARWGTPVKWLAPEYPKVLLEQKITGRVDLVVMVSAEGRMQDLADLRVDPPQSAFEDAVRDAMRHWTFAKAMDAQCRPVPVQGRLQIRFDINGSAPQVTVAGGPVSDISAMPRLFELNRSDVNQGLMENFPMDARRSGRTGDVHALLKVDPKTGATKDVDIVDVQTDRTSYNTDIRRVGPLRTATPASPLAIQFASVAREELIKLRFQPLPNVQAETVSVCREVSFQMRGIRRK